MKELGGFFELELNEGKEYHSRAIKLNLGRTSLEYVLKAKSVKKLFIPYYTCDVIFDNILKANTKIEFYFIDEKLEPIFDFSLLETSDFFLYTNYFGIKNKLIKSLSKTIKNLIIDNSQAFYSKPLPGADTFYSPRKFFGVPDGGYLYTNKFLPGELKKDNSSERFEHLIGRIEMGPVAVYNSFKATDNSFVGKSIMKMSEITQRLLAGINYENIAEKRKANFKYLCNQLNEKNQFEFEIDDTSVPMVYPFLTRRGELHQELINEKIYVAKYWENVKKSVERNSVEAKLVDHLVPLPVDQRYGLEEMKIIAKKVLKNV